MRYSIIFMAKITFNGVYLLLQIWIDVKNPFRYILSVIMFRLPKLKEPPKYYSFSHLTSTKYDSLLGLRKNKTKQRMVLLLGIPYLRIISACTRPSSNIALM